VIALDTETTGLDLYHGALPFFVTTSDEEGNQKFWEWEVDPLTRKPQIPPGDLDEIHNLLEIAGTWGDNYDEETSDRHAIITQNGKFDATALRQLGIDNWPWDNHHDTLIAAHILASNQPHDLTSLALHYLAVDILPFEDNLRKACISARTIARRSYPRWILAKKGTPGMPSARGSGGRKVVRGVEKDSLWKFDCWLPKLLADRLNYPEGHPWYTVLRDYANADSAITAALWQVLAAELKSRGYWKIYKERMKLIRCFSVMEERGATMSKTNTEHMECVRRSQSENRATVLVELAKGCDYDLKLPKSGTSKNLSTFAFDVLGLPVVKTTKKGGNPSLDDKALEEYVTSLPHRSKALCFVKNLREKRKFDTALLYLDQYKRYRLPYLPPDWFVLHPSVNVTGTDTLRHSHSNPNTANVSKRDEANLRYCFGPAPGREWWCADGQNLELRIPAYLAGEEEMIRLFERPNDPPYYGSNHLLNFHTVYPDIWEVELKAVGYEKVGPHIKEKYAATWYQWGKNGGFAVQYGAVLKRDVVGTADRAFHRPGSHAKLVARFQRIHGSGGLNEQCIREAEKYGYVETVPRKSVDPIRGYPLMVARTEWGSVLPTVPLNYKVQGTAMDWTNAGHVRCQEYLDKLNADLVNAYKLNSVDDGYHIVLEVHDELVFDFPAGTGPEPWKTNLPVALECKRLMEKGGEDIGVPTPVSLKYHPKNWAEGKAVKV